MPSYNHDDSLLEIINRLIMKTQGKSIEWEAFPNGYEYSMPDSSIRILTSDRNDMHFLYIYNKKGDIVANTTSNAIPQVSGLYNAIDDTVLNRSGTLNSILARLDGTADINGIYKATFYSFGNTTPGAVFIINNKIFGSYDRTMFFGEFVYENYVINGKLTTRTIALNYNSPERGNRDILILEAKLEGQIIEGKLSLADNIEPLKLEMTKIADL